MSPNKIQPIIDLSRRPPNANTRVLLFTSAAGRCEFDNCNRYLLTHPVTHRPGNFAEMAHIVAFRPGGPRGAAKLTLTERNDVANLMLLCPTCHKLVDTHPDLYPVDTLKAFKRDHEARIRMLTDAKADKQTISLLLRATIGSSPVSVPTADMQAAVAPFYLDPRHIDMIELTAGSETRTDAYWHSGAETIRARVQDFYARLRNSASTHISVFALAPIPYLIVLGGALSNKYPTALFQRHRDTDDWRWKEEGAPVDFTSQTRHEGADPTRVALALSVSGAIPGADYAAQIDDTFTVYEVLPTDVRPSVDILQLRSTLDAFRTRYRATLQQIAAAHPRASEVHIFPALPAPAAVAAGLDWIPKAHPSLRIYDKCGDAGFTYALDIRNTEAARTP